jgi:hypothetical protein
MDFQNLVNIAASAALMALGWWCRQIWDSVQELKKDVQKIEVDLPTNYVRQADMNARFDRIETILNQLFERLDRKVDK